MSQPLPGDPLPSIFRPEPILPAVVSVAAALMVVQGIRVLAFSLVSVFNHDLVNEALDKQAQKLGSGLLRPDSVLVNYGLVTGLVIAVIVAGLCVTLAVLLRRGSNPARIATWVVCGLSLCNLGTGTTGISADNAFLPGWYNAYQLTHAVAGGLLSLAVIVLLLLPASNDFYTKNRD